MPPGGKKLPNHEKYFIKSGFFPDHQNFDVYFSARWEHFFVMVNLKFLDSYSIDDDDDVTSGSGAGQQQLVVN